MIKVNPNRMELLKLKKRLQIARRGHKLLKDKLDELMKYFLDVLNEMGELRKVVERELNEYYLFSTLTWVRAPEGVLEESLSPPPLSFEVEEKKKIVLNLPLPRFEVKEKEEKLTYSLFSSPLALDKSIKKIQEILPDLFKLAALEKSLFLLAEEIEKTKRRVNALENTVIPALEETIKYITMKLDEMDRETRTRLMKIKEMLEAAG